MRLTETRLHGIGHYNGKKFALVCGLGCMGVGALWFEWRDRYENKKRCDGCMQGEPFWDDPKELTEHQIEGLKQRRKWEEEVSKIKEEKIG